MKSAPGTQPALGSVVVFQVVNSPPWASTAHSCSRPSGSGATATCDAAAGSGPVSAQASAHGTQPALGSVVVFQVVNSPPWASTAHSCSRPSDSGATAACDAAAGSGPVSGTSYAHGTQPALGSVVVFQVVNSPPWASTAHSCSRPSDSGATATCDAAAGSGPVSARKSAHGTQPALGSVVVFQVVNSPPWASTAHSCSRPSD